MKNRQFLLDCRDIHPYTYHTTTKSQPPNSITKSCQRLWGTLPGHGDTIHKKHGSVLRFPSRKSSHHKHILTKLVSLRNHLLLLHSNSADISTFIWIFIITSHFQTYGFISPIVSELELNIGEQYHVHFHRLRYLWSARSRFRLALRFWCVFT